MLCQPVLQIILAYFILINIHILLQACFHLSTEAKLHIPLTSLTGHANKIIALMREFGEL